MNRKTFLYIFSGVVTAGLICLVAGLIVFYTVKENAVATIVSLFAIIAGAIMAGIGLVVVAVILILIKTSGKSELKRRDGANETETGTDKGNGLN